MGTSALVEAHPPAWLTAELMQQASQEAASQGQRLISALERHSGLPADAFVQALGSLLRYPVLEREQLFQATPDFDRLSLAGMLKHECALIELDGQLAGVLADPFDDVRLARLDQLVDGGTLYLVHLDCLNAFLATHEEGFHAVAGMQGQGGSLEVEQDAEQLSLARISEDASVVVKLVNATLYDALKAHASDIHLGMSPGGLSIKYRIDGVLNNISSVAGNELAEQVISRIKIMAELDISERRVPQDGRFKVSIKGRQIDFRVSIMPSIFGEDAVLRVLDKQDLADRMQGVCLDALGFEPEVMRQMRELATDPYGMVLVTGPTGSGKTTTLYAMISEINHGLDKIITIEDPVEYQLPGVLQIPVNEKKGLTFARGLRSILRHDPDKIMVGEIRDAETAQIAVQSALTGHLVFTTLHANNVFDVIGRLAQMEVDPYNLVAALNAVLAQRLVRLVCPHCRVAASPDDAELLRSGIGLEQREHYRFTQGKGCHHCRGTGYRGRTAIAELLRLDDELRQMIVERQPISRIRQYASVHGLQLLRQSALQLVACGRTSLEEINRVTFAA
ncbi:GspE/PulE family protein [Halopseudomonas phragmitis]|nr:MULTISPECIES: GspE/PulE family protein [Pseudomonadaceae]